MPGGYTGLGKLLALGLAATLLAGCVAVLSAQGGTSQRSSLAHQPHAAAAVAVAPSAATMASPDDGPLSAEALSAALWVRLGATNHR